MRPTCHFCPTLLDEEHEPGYPVVVEGQEVLLCDDCLEMHDTARPINQGDGRDS